jgi:chloride channel protein, CIC family
MSSPEAPGPSRKSRFGRFFWKDPNTQFLLLAAVAGVLGALGAVAFRTLTASLTRFLIHADNIVRGCESLPIWGKLLWPTLGGLCGGFLALWFVREKGPSGISQMIESVTLARRPVRLRTALGRVASSIAVISTGGSEGREGPIVQLGAALASSLSRRLKVSPERVRILTACGMAAGIAGAYNTPIAATLFVLEVVVGSFSMTLFGPTVVSAVTSTLVVRFLLGDEPVYNVAPFHLQSVWEVIPFILIGLAAGPASALLMRALREAKKLFAAMKLPVPATMALGGLIVGAVGILLPEVWGNGFEGTDRILHGNPTLGFLALLFAGKMVATSATIGSGGVGGVFTPTLMVGATVGGMVARLANLIAPAFEAPVGGYALLGMGGLMAGVTRAPLLALIMIFELTQNTAVLLPMMLVSVLAVTSARVFEEDSIYVQSLRSVGIIWEKTPEATMLSSLRVSEIMRTDVAPVPRTLPLPDILNAFLRTRALYLYVVDEQGSLLGVIDLHDIKETFRAEEVSAVVIAEDLVREIPFVTPEEPLTSVNEKLWFRDLGQLPVVESPQSRKFLGIVTRRDLLGAFDREVLQHNRLLARVRTVTADGGDVDYFELPEKHQLVEVPLPRSLEGRTISESAMRQRLGVSILAIRRWLDGGLERRFVPGPEDRFQDGDVLVVLGSDDAIAKLRAS